MKNGEHFVIKKGKKTFFLKPIENYNFLEYAAS
jgi:hypothetical protein